MKKKLLTLALISIILLIHFFVDSHKVDVNFKDCNSQFTKIRMTQKDKRRLEFFFHTLFRHGPLGYTLNGPKPICSSAIRNFDFKNPLSLDLSIGNLFTLKGYKTWEKYQGLFNRPNFCIWTETSDWSDSVEYIFIANKKTLIPIIQAHANLFNSYANINCFEKHHIIQHLDKKSFYTDYVKKNELLMGILYGFGVENASLYYKRLNDPSIKMSGFWDDETRQSVRKKFSFNKSQFNSRMISYPFFAGDSTSDDGKYLKQLFLNSRADNLKFFENGDFLENVFTMLARNE